jgi:drug/metabolite transporter (DMT)-like permease
MVWIATCVLWSTVWLAIKIGVSSTPPLTVAWVRLAIALAVLVPVAAARSQLWLRSLANLGMLAVSGLLLLGLNYACVFWASQYLPSALVAVIQSATPVAGMLLATAWGVERATREKTVALLIGMAGVAVICAPRLTAQESPHVLLAFAAALLSVLCVATGYVFVKASGHHLNPTTVITWQMIAGGVPLAIAALVFEGSPFSVPWTPRALAATVYLALAGSVCAFWLNYWLLQRMPASALLLMGIVETPLAAMLGWIVLGERLGAWTWAGTSIVLVATGMMIRASHAGLEKGRQP